MRFETDWTQNILQTPQWQLQNELSLWETWVEFVICNFQFLIWTELQTHGWFSKLQIINYKLQILHAFSSHWSGRAGGCELCWVCQHGAWPAALWTHPDSWKRPPADGAYVRRWT